MSKFGLSSYLLWFTGCDLATNTGQLFMLNLETADCAWAASEKSSQYRPMLDTFHTVGTKLATKYPTPYQDHSLAVTLYLRSRKWSSGSRYSCFFDRIFLLATSCHSRWRAEQILQAVCILLTWFNYMAITSLRIILRMRWTRPLGLFEEAPRTVALALA